MRLKRWWAEKQYKGCSYIFEIFWLNGLRAVTLPGEERGDAGGRFELPSCQGTAVFEADVY
jgi:hypothetical protein